MLLFLVFGSWSVERSERSSQVSNVFTGGGELLGHFISLTFDLI